MSYLNFHFTMNKIINSVEYQEIITNRNVFLETKKFLEINPSGLNIHQLSDKLKIPEKYLKVILDIYHNNWCTFFQYGRIINYSNVGVYIYLHSNHPQVRTQKPYLKFSNIPIKNSEIVDTYSLKEENNFLKNQLSYYKTLQTNKVCKVCKSLM